MVMFEFVLFVYAFNEKLLTYYSNTTKEKNLALTIMKY